MGGLVPFSPNKCNVNHFVFAFIEHPSNPLEPKFALTRESSLLIFHSVFFVLISHSSLRFNEFDRYITITHTHVIHHYISRYTSNQHSMPSGRWRKEKKLNCSHESNSVNTHASLARIARRDDVVCTTHMTAEKREGKQLKRLDRAWGGYSLTHICQFSSPVALCTDH